MTDQLTAHERIPANVYPGMPQACQAVASEIANLIRSRASEGRRCVLGLATGSTPLGVYEELVRLHKQEGLSFQNVVTFNLDEYYPMQRNELQSYVRFMREHLFDLVDVPDDQVHIPDGTIPLKDVASYCEGYERAIVDAGGIDIQILGIGRTGHIGFNEPGSGLESRTRLITLDGVTRIDAASDFFGEESVPRRAITMGVGTILKAERVFLLAFGEHKAPILARAIEGEITASVAASFLQQHPSAQVVLDEAAAAELTRYKTPWLVGPVEWDDRTTRNAVIWLARLLDKPLLKLTDQDYNEDGLQDLLAEKGPAYNINLTVFRHLQSTIAGWPGGKPEDQKRPGDLDRPFDSIFPKRILIFSPHPDDDVISMGGTLIRLVDQSHDVHIAYQTSGNIAVFDDDAATFIDFAAQFNHHFKLAEEETAKMEDHVDRFLTHKNAGQVDSLEVQQIKGLIRRCEAIAGARCCGVPQRNLHFMDMPFYQTGRVKKRPLGAEDIQLTVDLMNKLQPHQIYAAGDLSDPHGTHRTCLTAILQACEQVKDEPWYAQCVVWLYRGAWQEWGPDRIEMAVPLSPQEVARKRAAIFKHESQKDRALFPGPDMREFWQRAEARNADTANLYDALGLAEYEAIEGFVRWDGTAPG